MVFPQHYVHPYTLLLSILCCKSPIYHNFQEDRVVSSSSVSLFLVPGNSGQLAWIAWWNEWISWLLRLCWCGNSIEVIRTSIPLFILGLIPQTIVQKNHFIWIPRSSFIHPNFFHPFGTLIKLRVVRVHNLFLWEKYFLGLAWIPRG